MKITATSDPRLATEKLSERHQISISVETVRHWMIADGLWVPHARRKPRVYQPRYRRECLGKLIQIDGSHHDWFEGRASKCCLLVYIDDATGRLMHLRFCETESAFDYMLTTREYIDKPGKPVAFYSDKHTVFRVSQAETRRTGTTQFGRVLHVREAPWPHEPVDYTSTSRMPVPPQAAVLLFLSK